MKDGDGFELIAFECPKCKVTQYTRNLIAIWEGQHVQCSSCHVVYEIHFEIVELPIYTNV